MFMTVDNIRIVAGNIKVQLPVYTEKICSNFIFKVQWFKYRSISFLFHMKIIVHCANAKASIESRIYLFAKKRYWHIINCLQGMMILIGECGFPLVQFSQPRQYIAVSMELLHHRYFILSCNERTLLGNFRNEKTQSFG